MDDDSQERGPVRWEEMRCVGCGRLLQKIEQGALRAGKLLEVKCVDCKTLNYVLGKEPDDTL